MEKKGKLIFMNILRKINIGNHVFAMTNAASPEQYNVYCYPTDGEIKAYVHVDHGMITAECPDFGGVIVYKAHINRNGGCFHDDVTRNDHLTRIEAAITKYYAALEEKDKKDPCPYCKESYGYDDNHVYLFNNRTHLSKKRDDFYPGLQVDISGNELDILAVADTYEPGVVFKSIKIHYCPMCGRNLDKED